MTKTNLAEIKQISKSVASQTGMGSVRKFFNSQKSAIQDVLPKHLTADRMLRIAIGALRTSPKLMNCRVETLFGAIVHCSQLGLEPNTPLGHAYLIPFENRKRGITEVQVIFGYRGLIDLARRSGQIVSIAAHEVCENDEFEFFYGLEETLKHTPAIDNRGEVIRFYAVAKLVGGGHAFEVMSVDQVNRIRDNSQNYKFAKDKEKTVWGQHYVEMGRKTVLRRLFKYLPISIELATAAYADEAADDGRQNMDLENVIDGDFVVVEDDQPENDSQAEEERKEKETPAESAAMPAHDTTKPFYTNAEFDRLFPLWEKSVADGKHSIDEIVATAQANRSFTKEQYEALQQVNATEELPFD